MKLITWNCQGAFRKKADYILAYNPDIVVIQECENTNKLVFGSGTQKPNDILWFGDNPNKGLCLLSYSDYRFQLSEYHNPAFKTILPVLVSNSEFSFLLFGIWANNPNSKDGRYIEQVWNAINYYESLLLEKKIIFIGDFNSNTIWDRKNRVGNHSEVVSKLEGKDIFSLYHKHLKEEHGKESIATFYLQRNKNKTYHIDYCFASSEIYQQFRSFEVGQFDFWVKYSDHLPVFIDFEFKIQRK